MTKDEVQKLLEQLYGKKRQRDILQERLDNALDAVIPQELKDQLEIVRAEFGPAVAEADRIISDLTKQIVDATRDSIGDTVRTDHLMCVYTKGSNYVTAKDVLSYASRIEMTYPDIARDLRSIVLVKKSSANIQEIK